MAVPRDRRSNRFLIKPRRAGRTDRIEPPAMPEARTLSARRRRAACVIPRSHAPSWFAAMTSEARERCGWRAAGINRNQPGWAEAAGQPGSGSARGCFIPSVSRTGKDANVKISSLYVRWYSVRKLIPIQPCRACPSWTCLKVRLAPGADIEREPHT